MRRVKRVLDLVMGSILLLACSAIAAVLAIAVRIQLGEPVIFCHRRAGQHGRIFPLYKFRTLTNTCDRQGRLLPDRYRMTRLGARLRRLSLDELPQLWNVLRGDMSLVGPRPLLPEYLPRYNSLQYRRHEVKPGITGWAQVNGRNSLSWEQKFELDVWYVDHWSLGLDAKIVWMTILQLFRREGINQPGHVTMSEFMGTPNSPEAR